MAKAPPSGIVSFLFTDIEGSSRLWDDDSARMSSSLEVHDELLAEAIGNHHGHVFSRSGDGLAAAFSTTADALRAARDAQLALLRADWPGPALRVRMGIHTGEAEERGGDYFGPVLNRASRIMAMGNGGQVLVSSTTAGMASDWGLGDGVTLLDVGDYHLRDLAESEHVFELRHPALPIVDRPLRTDEQAVGNLPDYLTSFVGRRSELDQLDRLMESQRLVTLTGVGGTGKTRLAVEAATRRAGGIPDGAWFVELAPITRPDLVMTTIGELWGLRPGKGAPIEDVVTRHLREADLLVVVDNCEHLLEKAADAVEILLGAGSGIRVLATSRESLGIVGESILRVPSLGLASDVAHARESDAVALFLDRAANVLPGYDPGDRELEAIDLICTRIDGIPLGLELAAARLRSMSVYELAERLDHSFRILSGSAKTALPRQRTLNATIDWSYRMLSDAEKAVFRRLSVFVGGFGLGAAEDTVASSVVATGDVLDLLDSLIDKSLLVAEQRQGREIRYRMLEPIRQYAQELLADSGEAGLVQKGHASFFTRFVREAAPRTRGPQQMMWEQRLTEEYDNIRSAFTVLLESKEHVAYLDMAFDLFSYWQHAGHHLDGIATTEAGLDDAPDETDANRLLKAYFTMAALGFEATLPRSVDDAGRGLEIAKTTGDPNAIGRLELALGAAIRHSTTDPAFAGHVLEGRRLIEEHREPRWWEADWEDAFHDFLFSGYLPPGTDRIREHSERAISTFERLGDEAQLAATLCESAMQMGTDADEWIVANLRRASEILERIDVPYWHGHAYYFLGILEGQRGNDLEAIAHLHEALPHLEDAGDMSCWGGAMRRLAGAEAGVGRVDEAKAHLLEVVEELPSLPMHERAVPLIADTVAVILAADRVFELAGRALGLAESIPRVSPIDENKELHEDLREQISSELGTNAAEGLIVEGSNLHAADLPTLVRDWLNG